MPRSEYYEPALLPGEKEQPQIIIDAVELYDLLVRAEMMMTKADRIRYGNRAVAQIQDVIKEFMLAYDFEEDRRIHLKRLCANMAIFMWTVRLIGGRNVINVRDARSGETPDQIKVRIMAWVSELQRLELLPVQPEQRVDRERQQRLRERQQPEQQERGGSPREL